MGDALKYLVDESGNRQSVIVPIEKWDKLNKDNNRLKNKLKVLTGIERGLKESKSDSNAFKSLDQFIDENKR
ncbi:hypothetical protein [Ekhidna sp.]|uniref:hypothetical protein n=1 Tax=Ekhidna sp. TaxID=2608089 RepID=UPI003CCBCBE2